MNLTRLWCSGPGPRTAVADPLGARVHGVEQRSFGRLQGRGVVAVERIEPGAHAAAGRILGP